MLVTIGKCPDDAVCVCLLSLLCGSYVVVQAKGQRVKPENRICNYTEKG